LCWVLRERDRKEEEEGGVFESVLREILVLGEGDGVGVRTVL